MVYNISNVVPGGVVVFFPSYEYEQLVYSHWQQNGYGDKIAAKKKVCCIRLKTCVVGLSREKTNGGIYALAGLELDPVASFAFPTNTQFVQMPIAAIFQNQIRVFKGKKIISTQIRKFFIDFLLSCCE